MRLPASITVITTYLLLSVFCRAADSFDAKASAEEIWKQAVDAESEQAKRALLGYEKALGDATEEVTKIMEAKLKDLNDVKKFTQLDIKQRAELIAELENKLIAIKENGAVEEAIEDSNASSSVGVNKVTLFEDSGYNGKKIRLGPGSYKVEDARLGNDTISSLKVPVGYLIIVYEHHFEGQSAVFTKSTRDLNTVRLPNGAGTWNDTISSFKIEKVTAPLSPDSYYYLSPEAHGEGKVLEIVKGGGNDQIALAAKNGTAAQKWRVTPLGGGYFRLNTQWPGANVSLDVVNDGKAMNRLRLFTAGNFSGQLWRISPEKNGYFRLTTNMRGDGFSLDAVGEGEGGDAVILNPSEKCAGQMWRFTTAD
ncbi:MAG: hypothetical protein ACKOKC_02675 [Chthoniobacterales bacterium]